MERRRSSLLRLLALALVVLAPGAAAASLCSGLELKQSKAPRKTAPGRRLRLSYTVRNTGATTRDVAVGVIVPPGVIVQTKSSGMGKKNKHAPAANTTVIDAELESMFGAYWPTSTLLRKKSRKFRMTLLVAKCAVMPQELLFQARVMEIDNNTVDCSKDFAQQQVAVKMPSGKYTPKANSTKAGAVCPVGYELTEIGYRCAEADDPTTFLGTNPTATQCYEYCYNYGGVEPPSYFEYAVAETGATCACVGDTCTRIAATDSFVFQTLPGAPEPPIPVPEGPLPATIEDTVLEMDPIASPIPGGVWNNGFESTPATATQEIMPIRDPAAISEATGIPEADIPASLYEGPFDSAYFQDATTSTARAFSGIYYYDLGGAFNGLLFKDFVLQGMEGSYWFYVFDALGARAPSYKITTYSFSTQAFSTFVWQPSKNVATQGPVVQQVWLNHNFTENTGSTDPWPVGTAGSGDSGWWCSFRCLAGPEVDIGPNTVGTVLRSLRTYVEGLLAQPVGSATYNNIMSAVIVGFRLDIGSSEAGTTAFTGDFKVSTPRPDPIYSWSWDFGA